MSFDKVKDAINLADYVGQYAAMKRAGSLMECCCPLPGHADKSPSFQVKDDRWVCRGKCGVGGDVFDFAQLYHGWDKAEALAELALYAGVTLEPLTPAHKAKQDHRARLYALMQEAADFYAAMLFTNPVALAYLTQTRGLSEQTIKAAGLGYAPGNLTLYKHLTQLGYSFQEMLDVSLIGQGDNAPYDWYRNRIVIPIREPKGRVVGFSGRAMDPKDEKKYLLPKAKDNGVFEKSKIIHIMPFNRVTMPLDAFKTLVIVEGTIDPVTALHRGFYNVVSVMGTSLTDEQLTLLCKDGVERLVFALDNDEAGHNALRRLVEKHMHAAADKGVDLYAMTIPHGKDADDTLREKPDLWRPAVDAARPVVDVLLERESLHTPPHPTPAQKQVWAMKILPLLKGANGFVNDDNLKKLAAFLGSSLQTVTEWTERRVHVLPPSKHLPVQNLPNLPSLELTVLHGILVNEDPQRWLDRANAVLSLMPYKKACAPLSQNDFSDSRTKAIMALITTTISNGIRPFDEEVKTQIGKGPLHETYERATYTPDTQAVFASHDARPAFTLPYKRFLVEVYRLRSLRLNADLQHKRIQGADMIEYAQARLHLNRLVQQEWSGV